MSNEIDRAINLIELKKEFTALVKIVEWHLLDLPIHPQTLCNGKPCTCCVCELRRAVARFKSLN